MREQLIDNNIKSLEANDIERNNIYDEDDDDDDDDENICELCIYICVCYCITGSLILY